MAPTDRLPATPAAEKAGEKKRWLRGTQIAVAALFLGVLALVLVVGVFWHQAGYWPIVVAGCLGGLVAVGELVARYPDDPVDAVLSVSAVVYVTVNAAAAVVALYLIHVFGWDFGSEPGSTRDVTQVLVAGFGSAALFRTSLFNVAVGDQVIGIGPSALLNVILAAADRAVDRGRARIRAKQAAEMMQGLPFEKGADALFQYSVATMQNLTPAEAKGVEDCISALRDTKNAAVPDTVKSYILGLALLSLVGDEVLRQATNQVRVLMAGEPAGTPPAAPAGTPAAAQPAAPAGDGLPERVLGRLEKAGGELPLQELLSDLGLDLAASSVISDLIQDGLLVTDGPDGKETIRLASR